MHNLALYMKKKDKAQKFDVILKELQVHKLDVN